MPLRVGGDLDRDDRSGVPVVGRGHPDAACPDDPARVARTATGTAAPGLVALRGCWPASLVLREIRYPVVQRACSDLVVPAVAPYGRGSSRSSLTRRPAAETSGASPAPRQCGRPRRGRRLQQSGGANGRGRPAIAPAAFHPVRLINPRSITATAASTSSRIAGRVRSAEHGFVTLGITCALASVWPQHSLTSVGVELPGCTRHG
jgi:hypothetical protein